MNTTSPHPTPLLVRQLLEETSAERRSALYAEHQVGLELVEALKAEVDRHKNADGSQALLAGERALEVSEFVSDPLAKPLGFWAVALGLTAQGEFNEALTYFEKARNGYIKLGYPINAARVSMRQVQALAMTGDYQGALHLAENIRNTFSKAKLHHETAQIELSIGVIYSRQARIAEAEEALKRSLASFKEVNNFTGVAQAHVNLGYACQQQDRFHEALEHLQAALEIFRELELTESIAGTLVNLAMLHRREGQANQALKLLSQARAVYNQLESSPDAALAQLEEARVSLDLQLLGEAEALASELVETFAARQMQLEQVEALVVLGTVRVRAGRLGEALGALQAARATWLELGNPTQAALVELYIANLHLSFQEHDDTGEEDHADGAAQSGHAKAAALAQSALVILREAGARSGVAFGLSTLGEAQLMLGEGAKAKDNLQEAETLAHELGVPDLIIRAKRLLGKNTSQRGELGEAERYFDGAIEALEGVRASLQIDEFKAAYVGDKLSVYGDMVSLLLEQERTREALSYAERAKSRALLDLLSKGVESRAPTHDPALEQLRERLKEVRSELNWHYLAAEDEGMNGPHWQKVTEGEREVTQLIRELERLEPEVAALERVAKPDLDKVFESLGEDTVLLEYFGTQRSLSAFVLEKGEVRSVTDIATPEAVRHHLERLGFFFKRVAQSHAGQNRANLPTNLPPHVYANLYGPEMLTQNVKTHLKALYDLLIAPLGLEPSAQTLVIVPHGPVHAVPFAALFDGERYLLERSALASAPSASVYALCKGQPQRPAGQMMAFGVPAEDIPAVEQEVEDVTKLFKAARAFIGVQASLDSFYEHAPQADVLHIATHGVHRPDNPMFSGLRLSDGWLAARDLYGVQLSASLVVLPACESVLASNTEGDELFGIARGFLYAGAPSLVGSLWPVQDEQTAQLMVAFYSALRRGLGAAAALREAQLAVYAEHPNPYHWAAFTVIGDPERTVTSAAREVSSDPGE